MYNILAAKMYYVLLDLVEGYRGTFFIPLLLAVVPQLVVLLALCVVCRCCCYTYLPLLWMV